MVANNGKRRPPEQIDRDRIREMRRTKAPILIGEKSDEAVFILVKHLDQWIAQLDLERARDAVRQSKRDFRAGRYQTASEVLAELRKR